MGYSILYWMISDTICRLAPAQKTQLQPALKTRLQLAASSPVSRSAQQHTILRLGTNRRRSGRQSPRCIPCRRGYFHLSASPCIRQLLQCVTFRKGISYFCLYCSVMCQTITEVCSLQETLLLSVLSCIRQPPDLYTNQIDWVDWFKNRFIFFSKF